MTDPTAAAPGTALVLPDDIMADLLKAQAGSVTTNQQLPDIGIMAAGVGLYEFSDQPGTTMQTFRGIVLNNHSRNILWDKAMGQGLGPAGEKAKPACSSNNGIVGIVRKGFAHKGLPEGEVGDDEKTVVCETCPYNKFGTGDWFKPNASKRGKAVSNQRAVYIMIPGIAIPYRLVLPPTSLATFDEYLIALVSRRIPVQTVITEFSQNREEKNGQKYGVAQFAMTSQINLDQFNAVMEMRKQFDKSITPAPVEIPLAAAATVGQAEGVMSAMSGDHVEASDAEEPDEALPF